MKLSIIVPVFNENETILKVIEDIKLVQLQAGIDKEIIVVDDGSTDGTREQLENFKDDPEVKILFEEQNKGKTAAVKIGIEHSTGDMIIIQDADLEYSPAHYPALLEPMLAGKASVVYGSRFMGNIQNMAFINRFANTTSRLTINLLFHTNMTDFHTCFKLFKRDVLRKIEITSKNFSFDTEVTVKLLNEGYQILEVPIEYTARKRKEGKKITWGTALESYWFLIKYRFCHYNK